MESAQKSAMHIYILRRFKSRVMPYICVCSRRRQVVVPFHPHSREAHTLSFSAPLPSRSIPQEAVQQSLGDQHPTPEQASYPEDMHIDHTYKTILVRLMMMERHDRRDRGRERGRDRGRDVLRVYQTLRTDMKYSIGGTPESAFSTRSFAGHGASGLHAQEHCIVGPWKRNSVVVPFTVVCMADDSAHGLGDSTVVTLLAPNTDNC